MNKAYQRFLKSALSDFCTEHRIAFSEILAAIDGKASEEPNEYAYAVGEGCHIALALDRPTVEAFGLDTEKIDGQTMDSLLESWCVEINDAIADDSGNDGIMKRTLHRAAADMGLIDTEEK